MKENAEKLIIPSQRINALTRLVDTDECAPNCCGVKEHQINPDRDKICVRIAKSRRLLFFEILLPKIGSCGVLLSIWCYAWIAIVSFSGII